MFGGGDGAQTSPHHSSQDKRGERLGTKNISNDLGEREYKNCFTFVLISLNIAAASFDPPSHSKGGLGVHGRLQ